MKNKLIIISAILVLLAACTDSVEIDSPEKEFFMNNETLGLYQMGKPIFTLNPARHQESFNINRKQYRIQTDEQDTCLNVILETYPKSLGVHISTMTDYRDPGNIITNITLLECSKIYDNKIWLWDKKSELGIIIPLLR